MLILLKEYLKNINQNKTRDFTCIIYVYLSAKNHVKHHDTNI